MPKRSSDDDAYQFDIVGYMDANENRHFIPEDRDGNRPMVSEIIDVDDTYGLWVRARNVNDDDDTHMFWAYVYDPFEDWAEWFVYITALMAGHGMELA